MLLTDTQRLIDDERWPELRDLTNRVAAYLRDVHSAEKPDAGLHGLPDTIDEAEGLHELVAGVLDRDKAPNKSTVGKKARTLQASVQRLLSEAKADAGVQNNDN